METAVIIRNSKPSVGRVLILSAFGAALYGPAFAAADDTAADACHRKDTTVDIMVCLDGLTARWDKQLNTAYQAALEASESPARKEALIRAERAWLAFRSANCDWYDAQEGTIREIAGADCMLDTTKARAIELQQAGPN